MLDKQIQLGQRFSPHTVILAFPRLVNTMIVLQVTKPFQNFSPAVWRAFCLEKKSQNFKHIIYQQ